MSYTKNFNFDDIEEGRIIRDSLDHEVQKVGKYIKTKGWQVIPENLKKKTGEIELYVPDDRWPGRYELLIED